MPSVATIFPEDASYHRPDSEAERRLYPVLGALPDEYTVYCNRRWHTPPRKGRPAQPAEADFLVAHPDRGVLVVEVKGGLIRYDPGTDSWFSNDVRLEQSPFAQVQRTRYRLREMLRASSARVQFPLGEAVAFPDVDIAPRDLPLGEVPERVIGASDLTSMEPALIRAFETFGLEDNGAVFGRRGVSSLTATIAGPVQLKRRIGGRIAESEAELIRLTENQYELLDALDGNQRVLITGGAGTGKTLLAVEEARRLAAQGLRVLVTCFNQPLGVHLAGELKELDSVEALHFHGLCTHWAKEAHLDTQQRSDEAADEYYEHRMPNLLAEAADRLERRVDAVVVDEAQDFLPDWLDTLELLLEDRDGIMFLFADENQAIFRRSFIRPAGFARYRLTANLRNTGAIHQLLVAHFGERSIAHGSRGVDVVASTWSGERELRHELSGWLTRLRDNGVPGPAITVLTGRSTSSSRFARDDGVGVFRLCTNPKRGNEIRLATVHRFKGLESPVVILCEMEDIHRLAARALWYTGISRARSALILLVHDPGGTLTGLPVDDILGNIVPKASEAPDKRIRNEPPG
jgi:ATP:corrinoid adenosyltransferase